MSSPNQPEPLRVQQVSGCLVLGLVLFTTCLLPFMLVDLGMQALANLHLSFQAAMLVLVSILLGSAINIPIKRRPLDSEVVVPVFEPLGGWMSFPRFQRVRQEQVVAVNVGGCIVPVLLAVWLSRFIVAGGATVIAVALIGMAVNTALCYTSARPVPKIGIALPFFLPALVALTVTWLGLPGPRDQPYHAPVAFVIGISGPLLGADLLHWKDFTKISAGSVSIGGAGTWDGIVLSGLIAALFA
jgi:uncharacterized membrane protein